MNQYVFGGHVYVSGTLDNGKKWDGYRVLLAPLVDGVDYPSRAVVCKAPNTDGYLSVAENLVPGDICEVFFDANGKIAQISTV